MKFEGLQVAMPKMIKLEVGLEKFGEMRRYAGREGGPPNSRTGVGSEPWEAPETHVRICCSGFNLFYRFEGL